MIPLAGTKHCGYTTSDFTTMTEGANMLDEIRRKIGNPERRTGWFKQPPFAFPEPEWLRNTSAKDDPLKNNFEAFRDIWKHGVVVWGAIVRANYGLFEPDAVDSSGTVMFSTHATDEKSLELLPNFISRMRSLRAHETPDEDWSQKEKEWWEDMQDDMSYQKGVRLPANWHDLANEFRGSCVLFHPPQLPDGRIQSRLLPLLVDPVSNYTQIIPYDYWPEGMAAWLLAQFRYYTQPKGKDQCDHEFIEVEYMASDPVDRTAKEEAYVHAFGLILSVFHEIIPRPHHIDIYRFQWIEPRNEYGYITGGMSDACQPHDDPWKRIELAFYSKSHDEVYPQLLRTFAHYPWETGSSIGPWHTIPLYGYAKSVTGSERFPALLFIPGLAKPEAPLYSNPIWAARGIRFLTIAPITQEELDFSMEKGIEALMDRIVQTKFDLAFDPDRPSLV